MKCGRLLLVVGGIALLGVLVAGPGRHAALRQDAVRNFLFKRGFAMNYQAGLAQRAKMAEPELRVLICGSGSPMPNRTRAGPCAAVIAAGKVWLVDSGGGGWRNMMLWRIPGEDLAAVLLTHFHSDHIQDLGEVNMQSWVAGRPGPLRVYGGPGVARVVSGFDEAYAQDTDYRVAHHGKATVDPDREPMEAHVVEAVAGGALKEGETRVVLDEDGMKITAIGVNHFPVTPAYGYRFDYGGRAVVISGDTKESPGLAEAAKGADVLVHEAQQEAMVRLAHDGFAANGVANLAKLMGDIQTYHTTPEQAAHIANLAGAKLLVLTHLTPPLPDFIAEPAFLAKAETVRRQGIMLGYDGLLISLPSKSDGLDISDLN